MVYWEFEVRFREEETQQQCCSSLIRCSDFFHLTRCLPPRSATETIYAKVESLASESGRVLRISTAKAVAAAWVYIDPFGFTTHNEQFPKEFQ